jgi:synaptosomal-associated protein 25
METLYLACRQNKALVPFGDDVDELNFIRLKGANQRGRWLLGK